MQYIYNNIQYNIEPHTLQAQNGLTMRVLAWLRRKIKNKVNFYLLFYTSMLYLYYRVKRSLKIE